MGNLAWSGKLRALSQSSSDVAGLVQLEADLASQITNRIPKTNHVLTFADALAGDHTGYDIVKTAYHHNILYGGAAEYRRTGNTGTAGTGDEGLFYDPTGAEFAISSAKVTPKMFGATGVITGSDFDEVKAWLEFLAANEHVGHIDSGDYILYRGTFEEISITLQKPLVITSDGRQARLHPYNSTISIHGGAAKNIDIDGLTLIKRGSFAQTAGLKIEGLSRGRIANSYFSEFNQTYGLRVTSETDFTDFIDIDNCHFSGCYNNLEIISDFSHVTSIAVRGGSSTLAVNREIFIESRNGEICSSHRFNNFWVQSNGSGVELTGGAYLCMFSQFQIDGPTPSEVCFYNNSGNIHWLTDVSVDGSISDPSNALVRNNVFETG